MYFSFTVWRFLFSLSMSCSKKESKKSVMEAKIMRVVQQGEAFAVQSQKSETGQVKKCNILLQELGGKYADQYACTMLGNAATCRFSRDELVAVSLRFTVNEYEGRHYQDILVADIHRLNR